MEAHQLPILLGRSPSRCPYCHDGCGPEDDSIVCNDCLARHHRECWAEACASCRSTRGLRAPKASRYPTIPCEPADRRPLTALAPEVQSLARHELGAGEAVIWVAQPKPNWSQSIGQMLFGLPWTAFTLYWMFGAAQASLVFGLFGLPFLLVGLCLLTAPLWADRDARNSLYILTDRRVIVRRARSGRGVEVHSYGPRKLDSMHRRQNKGGTGDLIFERAPQNQSSKHGEEAIGFLGIRDPRRVEALIRETLLGPARPPQAEAPRSRVSPSKTQPKRTGAAPPLKTL